ncbi:hypothetical protein RSAG8_08789, partial [Rhizoctonia solani AG-8 WAC10335]
MFLERGRLVLPALAPDPTFDTSIATLHLNVPYHLWDHCPAMRLGRDVPVDLDAA